MQNVYEQFFFLKYSGGWGFTEAYSLPVGLRKWFVQRLIKQLETEKEAVEKASKNKGGGSQELSQFNQPRIPSNVKKSRG